MFLLIVFAFFLKRYSTQAVPLHAPVPISAVFEAPIVARDDPSDGCQGRTVLNILWSCLATTFACTWVSVHPNMPFKGEGKWTIMGRRIFLMFFSILAPEFMVMWAFKQWRGAVMVKEAVNEAIMKSSSDKESPVQEIWTTTHGHLLQMGGFRLKATARENFFWKGSTAFGFRTQPILDGQSPPVDIDDRVSLLKKQYDIFPSLRRDEKQRMHRVLAHNLIPGHRLLKYEDSREIGASQSSEPGSHLELEWEGVLTFDTLKTLLKENLIRFPTITEDEINDKSKGDALSKGFALLQLTWFVVQIITRAVQGLAITELELTTAALAGLNSAMYVFWWNKPRDVRIPIIIRTKGMEERMAKKSDDTMFRLPDSDADFDFRKYLWKEMANYRLTFLVSIPAIILRATLKLVGAAGVLPHYFYSHLSRIGGLKGDHGTKSKHDLAADEESNISSEVVDLESSEETHSFSSYYEEGDMSPTQKLLYTIFIYAAQFADYFLSLLWSLPLYVINFAFYIPISMILAKDEGDEYEIPIKFDIDEQFRVFSMMFYSEKADAKPLLGTSSVAGAVFGAVHCLAWHFSFSSRVEQIMWRAASLGIVGSCIATFQSVVCYDVDKCANGFWSRFRHRYYQTTLYLSVLAIIVYPMSRITLLAVAITSLRSLPPSAFDTVDWIEFIPHI